MWSEAHRAGSAPPLAEFWRCVSGGALGGVGLSSRWLWPAFPLTTEPTGAALWGGKQDSSPLTGIHPRWKRKQLLAPRPWGGALHAWGRLAELTLLSETWALELAQGGCALGLRAWW